MIKVNEYIVEHIRQSLKTKLLAYFDDKNVDRNQEALDILKRARNQNINVELGELLDNFSEFKGLGKIESTGSDDIFTELQKAFHANNEYKSFSNIVKHCNTSDTDWGIVSINDLFDDKSTLLFGHGNLVDLCDTSIKTTDGNTIKVNFKRTAKQAMNMHGACNGGGTLGPGEILIRFMLKEPIDGKATDGDIVIDANKIKNAPKIEVKGGSKGSGGHPQIEITKQIGDLYYEFENIFYNSVDNKDEITQWLDTDLQKTVKSPIRREATNEAMPWETKRLPYSFLQSTNPKGLTKTLQFVSKQNADMKKLYTELFTEVFRFSHKSIIDKETISACTDYMIDLGNSDNLGIEFLNCVGIIQYYIYQKGHEWTHLMVIDNSGKNAGEYVIVKWNALTADIIKEMLKYLSFGALDGSTKSDRNCTGKMLIKHKQN